MLESRPPPGAPSSHVTPLLDAGTGNSVTRLSGKVALITGGGTGIGRAIALAFAREGASVAVAGRRLEKLREVISEIQKQSGAGLAMECDVTRSREVERAMRGTVERFGRLNVLVNNAGAVHASTVEGISEEDWDRLMTVNVKGPFTFTVINRSQSSSLMPSTVDACTAPALFTSTFSRPNRSTVPRIARSTSRERVTSHSIANPAPLCFWISLITSRSFSNLRPATATLAPSRANASAIARPIPVPPPVISATLPESLVTEFPVP